ncbi:hypothetical protein ACFL6S_20040 [Candidatus Poribacteria bacterium]
MKIEVMRRDFILAAIAYRFISEELREVASSQNSEKVTLLTSVQNELEAIIKTCMEKVDMHKDIF